jgi:hypothetical protein
MSHEIKENCQKQYILPPCIEDWVPEAHPARFVRDFMEHIDMKELGFKEFRGTEGNPHHATSMQLKIWLYAYFNKVLIGKVLHALDGTKIRARISDSSGWHYASMEEKQRAGIKEVMEEIEGSERSDDFNYLLPGDVSDKTKRIEGIRDGSRMRVITRRSNCLKLRKRAMIFLSTSMRQ